MSSPSSPVPKDRWVPDEEGAACSVCHVEFSITRRRHHCRKCGSLVCGNCSDHFIPLDSQAGLSSTSIAVRVCDKCEIALRESSKEISEEIDVTDQINVSLKASLKEKVHELEKFESLIMHYANSAAASTSNANQAEPERFQSFSQNVGKICADLGEISTSYSDLKMSAKELESEIRLVAQRCMRAESIAREGTEISREIEKYSKQIGSQDRLILQLNERIQRLSAAPSVPSSPPPRRSSVQSPSSPAPRTVVFSASPSVIRSEETTVVAPSVNVVQVLKALVSI